MTKMSKVVKLRLQKVCSNSEKAGKIVSIFT